MALTEHNFNGKTTGLINTLKTGVRKDFKCDKTPNMQPKDAEFSTEGLPKAFLHSLRTLFDILDDGRRGYVHISEIESRWRGAETRGLPAGVLESLRRVAPRHGCLTFERFVAGLRHSMLNTENSSKPPAPNHRQPSEPPHKPSEPPHKPGRPFEGKVRPLGPSNGLNTQSGRQMGRDGHSASSVGCEGIERPEGSYRSDSIRIGGKTLQSSRIRVIESLALESPRVQKTLESVGLPRSQSESTTGFTRTRRNGRSQDEQRRHTITNGVDYKLLKQMKELEQEKDSLLAGLDLLEKAREWYQTQIHNVIETQRHVGQSHSTEFSTGSCQSRLEVLLPKLQDVSRCLSDLMTFPSVRLQSAGVCSSVAPPPAGVSAPPQAINILKEQNRLLTQEVTEKSGRIAQLEQEKSSLIKQLFEARARNTHDSSALDSTFI